MSMYDVHQALTQSFIDLALGVPLAHENADTDPPNDGVFVDLSLMPADTESLGKESDGADQNFGVYQASFYAPSGTSVGIVLPLVDTALQFYKHNRAITANSQVVTIMNSNRNGGRNVNGWYVVDVSIEWKADICRV